MKAGDAVRTTVAWNVKYRREGVTGTIISIAPAGPSRFGPNRTHYVQLDKPLGEWWRLWFDPEDLEPND